MKRCLFLILTAFSISTASFSQQNKKPATAATSSSTPRLVVGLVIDQMRWDYLQRFSSYFGTGGFNRLQREGFNCDNTTITHLPTYTAVGHAGIYTGSFPSIHGIVGNNWVDVKSGAHVYCTDDSLVSGVGSNNANGKIGRAHV